MSEYLQNHEYKQKILKGLIQDLHNGRDFNEVKKEFSELVQGIDATEIADMEQRLITEGMPPEEIKKLCDVHAAVFRDALSQNEQPEYQPGHPLYTLKHENDEARKLLDEIDDQIEGLTASAGQKVPIGELRKSLDFFSQNLDKHFSKKENIIFPYLERRGITGPPSVMWSVDDEIRGMLKELKNSLKNLEEENSQATTTAEELFSKIKNKVTEMFYKEEAILSPMLKESLTDQEWAEIKEQEAEFGEVFSVPGADFWQPEATAAKFTGINNKSSAVELDTGALTPQQINALLTNLPVDITFVDENDEVRYFSQTKERVFTRTKSIIGRKVQNCHPPESVHVVEKIVNDFKSGKHNTADFWLELNGKFIYIKYLAVKDEHGKYMGTMEVSQDITALRALEGERRLLQYEKSNTPPN